MAFPTIPTVAAGRVLTANIDGTGTRTFPSLSGLTKNSGDLLIAIIVAYQSSSGAGAPGGTVFSSWGASFTEFCDQMTTNSSTMAIGAAYKWSDGTETGTFTVTQAATITGGASLILLSIPGAHASTPPEVGTIANGTAAAANPGSFNPSGWDAEDTLWISVVSSGMTSGTGSWTATGTTAPTNYTDRVDTNRADDSTVGRVEGAVSFRQVNASSEDVGTAGVDVSNARNSALLIAVRPAQTGIGYIGGYGQDDGSNGETGGAITSDQSTFDFSAQAGDLIVVYIWTGDDSTDDTDSITVTDSASNTYTKVPNSSDSESTFNAAGATGSNHCLFQCQVTNAITASSTTLTITLPDSSPYVRYIVRCYRDFDGAGPLRVANLSVDQNKQTVGSGDPWVGGTVNVTAGDYLVGCVQSIPGSVTWSLGTGMTDLELTTTAGMAGGAHKAIVTTGTDAPTMNAGVADEGYGITYVVTKFGIPDLAIPQGIGASQ